MKIWGVAMVRNEADIIEAFVRHNLTVLDGMLVVDHASSDATLAILNAMCAERLPLVVTRVEVAAYLQAEVTTTAAREVFQRAKADAVIPLDADEFLRVPSRAALEDALAGLPSGTHARLPWPTYVAPLDGTPRDMVSLIRASRRLVTEPQVPEIYRHKVALTRDFAADASAHLAMGNHDVILGNNLATSPRMPHVKLPAGVAEVCHLPVRTEAQFVTKIAIKRLGRIAAGRDYHPTSTVAGAWRAILRGDALDASAMLVNHAGGLEMDAGTFSVAAIETADDPFLADIRLAHTASPVTADALPRVLAAAEKLVRTLARASRPGTHAAEAS